MFQFCQYIWGGIEAKCRDRIKKLANLELTLLASRGPSKATERSTVKRFQGHLQQMSLVVSNLRVLRQILVVVEEKTVRLVGFLAQRCRRVPAVGRESPARHREVLVLIMIRSKGYLELVGF